MNAYELANLADVSSPDSLESPGALFLLSLGVSVSEYADEDGDLDDIAGDIADQCVPIYTHERWQTFVDLAAYQEDVTDFGPLEDMTTAAGVALYMIGVRLVGALVEIEGAL